MCAPSEEAVFTFAASVVGAERTSDRPAAQLAFELAAGLLDGVPAGRAWDDTRGRLSAAKLFAWLLLQPHPKASELHFSAQVSGYMRDTPTPDKQRREPNDAD